MKPSLLNLFSILSIFLLAAVSQSIAQTPQRDNRPRASSVSGRVTIAGKPAPNAVITVVETDLKPGATGGLAAPIPIQAKTRTDGDGRYTITGLAEGRYIINALLKAFVAADSSGDRSLSRTLTLDEGEALEKVNFALIRGGVMTGKVIDDEGAPLIARHVQLFTLDDQGQKRRYSSSSMYYMSQTDDRGVYRIYGLPPGRYIISAGGEGGGDPLRAGGGKFARTYHPDTTDEKQARIIEIAEGSEVADVDIRFGSARKTYVAAGRAVDRDTGKPVPRISVACRAKPEKNTSYSGTIAIADGQGNFRLPGLPPGRYQATVMDDLSEAGYTGEAVEFEITNDDVSGLELKAFLGGSVSGVVVVEGADATTRSQPLSITVHPRFKMLSGATGDADERTSFPQNIRPARVNADGSFDIKGLRAGSLGFDLYGAPDGLRIKRVERDGVEIKDAIEVKPGEKITGVRIMAFRPQGRIRGSVQIVGGALPDGWRLHASAMRSINQDEVRPDARPVATDRGGGSVEIGKQGRFVIEGLPAGEYVLSVYPVRITGDGRWSSVDSPGTNQQVIVRENDETTVTVTFDISRKNQPKNQEDRQ